MRYSTTMSHVALAITQIAPLVLCTVPETIAQPFSITAASYLGDTGENMVRGAVILSDRTIVLAANIADNLPGDVVPILVNGATPASRGTLVRLSPDGKTLLSVTKLAAEVLDLAIDSTDNIYVAASSDGFGKLSPDAAVVVWWKSIGKVIRCDAGSDGTSAALINSSPNADAHDIGPGTIRVFDAAGTELGSFPGYRNTLDLAVHTPSKTVCFLGWRQTTCDGNPVQISFLRGTSYDGATKYTGYDWPTSGSPYLNSYTNNMADTRGLRCAVGQDGHLYCAFECAGGNHIFRYDPFDLSKPVTIVKGDYFHDWSRTASEHKTFFARYVAATGAYLLGQQFCTRLTDGRGNTARPRAIAADMAGRVYIGGTAGANLPLPTFVTPREGETAFNPLPDAAYKGGAWVLVMSHDLSMRLFCTRLTTSGTTWAIAARSFHSDNTAQVVWAGHTTTPTESYTLNAVQPTFGGGGSDGTFAVISHDNSLSAGSPCQTGSKSSISKSGVTVVDYKGARVLLVFPSAGSRRAAHVFDCSGKLRPSTEAYGGGRESHTR